MSDDYRHKGLRKRLVQELRQKGITDPNVLDAIGQVPRHLFIDDTAFLQMAYADTAFPIGHGQTISQPYTVAFQTELLGVSPGMKVLEIGTGSGYQTAVLVALGARVFSIERQRPLYLRTKQRLGGLGYKANLQYGDGFLGLPKEAPFDRVLVTCGAPFIPPALKQQLRSAADGRPGGQAVIPVGEGGLQTMLRIERLEDGGFSEARHGDFRFVPMLERRTG